MNENLEKIAEHLSYFGYELNFIEDEKWVLERSVPPATNIVLNGCTGGFNISIYYTLDKLHISTDELNTLNMNLISCKAMVNDEMAALQCWLPYIDDKKVIAHFIEVFKADAEKFEELVFSKVREINATEEAENEIVLN